MGVRYTPDHDDRAWLYPERVRFRFRSRAPFLEVGAGLFRVHEPADRDNHAWGLLLFGLRWQWPDAPVVLRIAPTLYIPDEASVRFTEEETMVPIPWIGPAVLMGTVIRVSHLAKTAG